jgi:rhodanese-related sulfurtransferase
MRASRRPMNDRVTGVDAMLADARKGVRRLTPEQTLEAIRRGAIVVDTRTEAQRRAQGELPGTVVIDRTVLEWRLDPASHDRIPAAVDYDVEVVIVCSQGYSSSLAAASLRSMGLWRATDAIGGVEGWIASGLPVSSRPEDARRNPPILNRTISKSGDR